MERKSEAGRYGLARRLQRRRSRVRDVRAAAVAVRRRHARRARRGERARRSQVADLSPRPLRRRRRAQIRRGHHRDRSAAGADADSDDRPGRVPLDVPPSARRSAPIGRAGVYLARVELPTAARASRRSSCAIAAASTCSPSCRPTPTRPYNTWGGESLYLDTRYGLTAGHGYQVSFDRPFDPGGQGGYFLYSAMPTVEYLEANGYDVAYAVDHDVHVDSSLLPRARLVMALAHDEYWSRRCAIITKRRAPPACRWRSSAPTSASGRCATKTRPTASPIAAWSGTRRPPASTRRPARRRSRPPSARRRSLDPRTACSA